MIQRLRRGQPVTSATLSSEDWVIQLGGDMLLIGRQYPLLNQETTNRQLRNFGKVFKMT